MSHWQGQVLCYVCNHRHVAVIELEAGYDEPYVPLECPGCGNRSCHPDDGEEHEPLTGEEL